jgi:uncharacterized protein YabE (DUF348 family)
LRSVRQSPARTEAPEPGVWLPILDVTGELEALDLNGELELLELEVGRYDLDRELQELESSFWQTAPRGLEEAVALIGPATRPETGSAPEETPGVVLVEGPELSAAEIEAFEALAPVPVDEMVALLPAPAAPAPERRSAPETRAAPAPESPALPGRSTAPAPARLPRPRKPRVETARLADRSRGSRLLVGLLVAVVIAGCAAVGPKLLGSTAPEHDVTLVVDGATVSFATRTRTVGGVLALEQVVLHPGDRVVPAADAQVTQSTTIRVLRSFPVDVDVDGRVRTVRTTRTSVQALRRELQLPATLVVTSGRGPLSAGASVVFRTPHTLMLRHDGRTTRIARTTALDVAALLSQLHIRLGPRDEVAPAPATKLANGMTVQVFRLQSNQVAEQVIVPFTTEYRDDPSLPRGEMRVASPGANGLRRNVYEIETSNGRPVARRLVGEELLTRPVPRKILKGTKPPAATRAHPMAASAPAAGRGAPGGHVFQTGSATWYGTGPGPGTCAHLTLPRGTVVTIVNLANGASAQCRVEDRGPAAWTGHIIDLAPGVFSQLAPLSAGVLQVELLVG